MIKDSRKFFANVLVHRIGRHDVENGQFGEAVRVVQSHPVRDAAAPVVPHNREFLESQILHHFDLVLRHGALRIGNVIFASRWLAAVAISAEIGDH